MPHNRKARMMPELKAVANINYEHVREHMRRYANSCIRFVK